VSFGAITFYVASQRVVIVVVYFVVDSVRKLLDVFSYGPTADNTSIPCGVEAVTCIESAPRKQTKNQSAVCWRMEKNLILLPTQVVAMRRKNYCGEKRIKQRRIYLAECSASTQPFSHIFCSSDRLGLAISAATSSASPCS